MLASRHLAPPDRQFLARFFVHPVLRKIAPKQSIGAAAEVMSVEEGAEIVDLAGEPAIVIVAAEPRHRRRPLQITPGEEHQLHDAAMDRRCFQRLEKTR